MIETLIRENSTSDDVALFKVNKVLQSTYPSNHAYGLTYHFAMVPYCKPKSVLMLGYGLGTIPGLIRKVWGEDVKVTNVDIMPDPQKYVEFSYVQGEADKALREFNKGLFKKKFDFILIDLFNGGDSDPCVFDKGFAKRIYQLANKGCYINTTRAEGKGLKVYEDAGFVCENERIVILGNNLISLWSKK